MIQVGGTGLGVIDLIGGYIEAVSLKLQGFKRIEWKRAPSISCYSPRRQLLLMLTLIIILQYIVHVCLGTP